MAVSLSLYRAFLLTFLPALGAWSLLVLAHERRLQVSSHLRVQGPQLDALKSATVAVFTPWKWATTTNQGFPLLSGIHC